MSGVTRKLLTALTALSVLPLLAVQPAFSASAPKKEPKIKLETLKPGKLKLDPRLGYILVRLGPKPAGKNVAASVGFARIDASTGKPFFFEKAEDIPRDFFRTSSVVVNPGRSFGDSDGNGVYLLGAYPGRWLISNVGATCLSMGSYSFDVRQGEISDIGTLLTARENGESTASELKGAKLSPDLLDFGVMMNIVMSEALYAKPATDAPALPKELGAMPVSKVALNSDHRSDNNCATLINRAASLPPIGHQQPMTREEAIAALEKINPPERVEAARKRAEKAKAKP